MIFLVPGVAGPEGLRRKLKMFHVWYIYVILVGYAQTAAVGIVLLTGSPVYTELS